MKRSRPMRINAISKAQDQRGATPCFIRCIEAANFSCQAPISPNSRGPERVRAHLPAIVQRTAIPSAGWSDGGLYLGLPPRDWLGLAISSVFLLLSAIMIATDWPSNQYGESTEGSRLQLPHDHPAL